MSKKYYLLLVLLVYCRFFDIRFLSFISNELYQILSVLLSLLGYFLYKKDKRYTQQLNSWKYKKWFYIFIVGVALSTFNAFLFHGQSFVTTILAQRGVYGIILILTLLKIQPTYTDFKFSLKIITVYAIFLWIYTIYDPYICSSANNLFALEKGYNTGLDIGVYVGNLYIPMLYFFMLINEYVCGNKKALIWIACIFVFFILYQNRSMLVGVAIGLLFLLWKFKSKYKLVFIGLSFLTIYVLSVTIFSEITTGLIKETTSQINDSDYNRYKALDFFINRASPNWFCFIFGNGYSSAHSNHGKYIQDLMSDGIFSSDVGLIGQLSIYGILTLIPFYFLGVRVIFKKKFPIYLRLASLHILIIPIAYNFTFSSGLSLFCLYVYLFAYYDIQSTRIKR